MLDVGNITQAMHDPARDFQAAFTIASLDRMPSASLVLVQPPGTRGSGDFTEAQVGARGASHGRSMRLAAPDRRKALHWFVVGLETSANGRGRGLGRTAGRQESAGVSSRRSASREHCGCRDGRDADAHELRRLALYRSTTIRIANGSLKRLVWNRSVAR